MASRENSVANFGVSCRRHWVSKLSSGIGSNVAFLILELTFRDFLITINLFLLLIFLPIDYHILGGYLLLSFDYGLPSQTTII